MDKTDDFDLGYQDYTPHVGQEAFHYLASYTYRYLLMLCGIRGGKTYAGARQAGPEAWNSECELNAVYGIIAPTYNMLDRTTWKEFKFANQAFIAKDNDSKKIITLHNGREVHGFSAENPDKIRNVTMCGAWVDEAREAKSFRELWKILLGRVLSTKGKIIVTSSPNSYDDMHEIFIENRKEGYGVINFPTSTNTTLDQNDIDTLANDYDPKFMEQELLGKIVIFEGAVYYTFDRSKNAGDLAFKVAQYDPTRPICLCADFNVDPMAWTLAQVYENMGLKEVRVFDEIFIRNSNTIECCDEFKDRFPNHDMGVLLYGDATGKNRSTNSNITNWKIIESELAGYGVSKHVPLANPSEKDRINAMNGMIKNSKGVNRIQIHPKCKHLIRDLEQVSYKEGTVKIDKGKDLMLTHPSDGFGYMIEKEFSLNRARYQGLKI